MLAFSSIYGVQHTAVLKRPPRVRFKIYVLIYLFIVLLIHFIGATLHEGHLKSIQKANKNDSAWAWRKVWKYWARRQKDKWSSMVRRRPSLGIQDRTKAWNSETARQTYNHQSSNTKPCCSPSDNNIITHLQGELKTMLSNSIDTIVICLWLYCICDNGPRTMNSDSDTENAYGETFKKHAYEGLCLYAGYHCNTDLFGYYGTKIMTALLIGFNTNWNINTKRACDDYYFIF